MKTLEKIHIANVQPGMVIVKLDKSGVFFPYLAKPILNLSVLKDIENEGVQYVYVKSNAEDRKVEKDFYTSYIPRGALIVGIAEAYNSMLKHTPEYLMHYNRKEAMRMLYQAGGTKYPLNMVKRFIGIMGVYPVGTVVKLSNGMATLVVEVHLQNQACPKVLLLDAAGLNTAEYLDLALHKNITIIKELNDFELNINTMQIFTDYIYSKASQTG